MQMILKHFLYLPLILSWVKPAAANPSIHCVEGSEASCRWGFHCTATVYAHAHNYCITVENTGYCRTCETQCRHYED